MRLCPFSHLSPSLPVQPFQVTAPLCQRPMGETSPGAAQRLGTLPISSCLLSPPIPFCVQSILQPILCLPSLAVLSPHIFSHVHLFPSYAFLSCPSFSLRLELKVSAAVLQQTRGLRQCLGNPHWSAVTCVTSGHSLLPAGGAAAGGCG